MNTVKRHRGEPEHTDKHSGPVQKQKSEEDRHQTERSGARTPIKRGGAGTHITGAPVGAGHHAAVPRTPVQV